MKSLTIHIVAVALALAMGTPSLAATGELSSQPVSQSEQDTLGRTAETATAPLYALSRLEAHTLAAQEMTDQELKAVEGGFYYVIDLGWMLGDWAITNSGVFPFDTDEEGPT